MDRQCVKRETLLWDRHDGVSDSPAPRRSVRIESTQWRLSRHWLSLSRTRARAGAQSRRQRYLRRWLRAQIEYRLIRVFAPSTSGRIGAESFVIRTGRRSEPPPAPALVRPGSVDPEATTTRHVVLNRLSATIHRAVRSLSSATSVCVRAGRPGRTRGRLPVPVGSRVDGGCRSVATSRPRLSSATIPRPSAFSDRRRRHRPQHDVSESHSFRRRSVLGFRPSHLPWRHGSMTSLCVTCQSAVLVLTWFARVASDAAVDQRASGRLYSLIENNSWLAVLTRSSATAESRATLCISWNVGQLLYE